VCKSSRFFQHHPELTKETSAESKGRKRKALISSRMDPDTISLCFKVQKKVQCCAQQREKQYIDRAQTDSYTVPPQHPASIRLGLERRGGLESVPTSGDHVTWASREHSTDGRKGRKRGEVKLYRGGKKKKKSL
jgi:hypothetical protein